MTKRLVSPAFRKALIEGPDAIVEAPVERVYEKPDLSIDSLMQRGLASIDRLMRVITKDLSTGSPTRETVMNLKDAMSMLQVLKEREEELLENMSEEDLESQQ